MRTFSSAACWVRASPSCSTNTLHNWTSLRPTQHFRKHVSHYQKSSNGTVAVAPALATLDALAVLVRAVELETLCPDGGAGTPAPRSPRSRRLARPRVSARAGSSDLDRGHRLLRLWRGNLDKPILSLARRPSIQIHQPPRIVLQRKFRLDSAPRQNAHSPEFLSMPVTPAHRFNQRAQISARNQ